MRRAIVSPTAPGNCRQIVELSGCIERRFPDSFTPTLTGWLEIGHVQNCRYADGCRPTHNTGSILFQDKPVKIGSRSQWRPPFSCITIPRDNARGTNARGDPQGIFGQAARQTLWKRIVLLLLGVSGRDIQRSSRLRIRNQTAAGSQHTSGGRACSFRRSETG